MNEELAWLAENVIEWSNDLDRVGICSTGVHWFSSERFPGRIGFSREELRVAKAELSGERMDNIARNGNDGEHYYSDITAYDPPGPTNIPECTFTTSDEDEAWAEAERRMDAIGQNGNDGLHYNLEDVAFVRAEGKQPRYQDATGEDWIDEAARTFTAEEFRGAMRFSIGKYNRRMGKKDDLIKEIEKMRDYCQRWIDVEKGR